MGHGGFMKVPFDRNNSHYIYILTRADLPPTDQAIQACHAGMEICKKHPTDHPERLVMLSVPDQDHLLSWSDRLHRAGIEHACFEEPDHDRSWTALATAPIQGGLKMFGSLPLWEASRLVPA
jgi:hypothetical protein